MADPVVDIMASVGNTVPLIVLMLLVVAPAFLVVGGIVIYFVVLKFDAYASIEYAYESRNKFKVYKMRYSKDRNFLKERVMIPLSKGEIGLPIAVMSSPINHEGKPLYRYYSPEPGVFIPMVLGLDRKEIVGYKKDEKGELMLDAEKKAIPIWMRLADLIPLVGFGPKQAYAESYAEADKLFQERNKLMQMILQWAPYIILFVLMLIMIVQISSLVANLQGGIHISVTMEQLAKNGTVQTVAPFFK